MDSVLREKNDRRAARKARIRKRISGTAERPRVSITFSNKYVSAQLIDDVAGKTLVAASSQEKDAAVKGKSAAAAKWAGATLAERASKIGVQKAVFDRNGYIYHGRVKDLADAIREKGILM
ncbi:MAG: 50S ribosomal protein L18 [Nitrospinae bacterium]|nr:50S ribosomal protein L18 [Nitrospinota bacterium]